MTSYLESRFAAIDRRLDGIDNRLKHITWAISTNAALVLLVLGKLFHG